jgi:hypothetical protein
MEAGRAGTSNFKLARDEATRILNELPRGSDASVVLTGEGGSALLDQPTYDTARVVQALNKVSAGYGPATMPAAFDFAGTVFGQTHEPARNLVLLTDFQRISFEATEAAQFGEAIQRLKQMPLAPTITFFDIGSEVQDNVAIESLEFSRLMVGVGQKIQIRANVRNFGNVAYPDLRVYFRADGKERAVSQISLGASERGQVLFTHAFEAAGSQVIEVFADADPLVADNIYLASIPVRDKVPLLLINGDPSGEPLKGETDFAEIALQPYSAGRVEMADLISTKVIKPEELDAKKLTEAAVVIMANVRKLNDDQLRALEDFVRNGGGLLLFAGSRVDAGWYNKDLVREGKGLLPVSFGALTGDLKETSPSVAIGAQRFENAALELFNDPRNGSLADSAIKLWFKLQDVPEAGGVTLARLENGDPFLVEKAFGEGRVIVCSTAIDADWSNLPMRPSYLPLLQRLSVYLASTVFPPRNLDVGKPIVAFLPGTDAGKQATVINPEGISFQAPIVKKGERGVVEFSNTQRPGLYTMNPPGGAPTYYVVNAARRESDLRKLSPQEIDSLAATHGVSLVRTGADYKALEHNRRYGREFWKPLLWIVLGLVFLELYLQQRFARARGTVSNVTTSAPRRNPEPERMSLLAQEELDESRIRADESAFCGRLAVVARSRRCAPARCGGVDLLLARNACAPPVGALAAADFARSGGDHARPDAKRAGAASPQSRRTALAAAALCRWFEEHGPHRSGNGCGAKDSHPATSGYASRGCGEARIAARLADSGGCAGARGEGQIRTRT